MSNERIKEKDFFYWRDEFCWYGASKTFFVKPFFGVENKNEDDQGLLYFSSLFMIFWIFFGMFQNMFVFITTCVLYVLAGIFSLVKPKSRDAKKDFKFIVPILIYIIEFFAIRYFIITYETILIINFMLSVVPAVIIYKIYANENEVDFFSYFIKLVVGIPKFIVAFLIAISNCVKKIKSMFGEINKDAKEVKPRNFNRVNSGNYTNVDNLSLDKEKKAISKNSSINNRLNRNLDEINLDDKESKVKDSEDTKTDSSIGDFTDMNNSQKGINKANVGQKEETLNKAKGFDGFNKSNTYKTKKDKNN